MTEQIRQAVVSAVFILAFVTSVVAQTPALHINGKIAFTSDRDGNREIYVMNADGTNQVRLTNNSVVDDHPTWSPDGAKIAFVSQRPSGAFAIFQMNADGTNKVEITPVNYIVHSPEWYSDFWSMSWAPDGNRIAFQDNWDIFVVNTDGSNRRRLTDAAGYDHEPSWSPDGSKILFAGSRGSMYPTMYTVRPDGTGLQPFPGSPGYWEIAPNWSPLGDKVVFVVNWTDDISVSEIYTANSDGTNRQSFDGSATEYVYRNKPSWSPDGSKIIFDMWEYSADDMEIYVKNANFSGSAQLTNTSGWNFHPSWQPLAPGAACPNPIDCADFFVRQQYLDFLLREPDAAGFSDWLAVLNNCGPNQGGLGSDPACDRVHVSSGFFRSKEFGEKGYWIYRCFEASLGRRPMYAEFMPEMTRLSGLMTDSEQETRRTEFIARFTQLPEFTNIYAGISDASHASQFIAKLEEKARVTLPAFAQTEPGQPPQYGRQQLIDLMQAGTLTPAQTLRAFIEQKVVWDTYFYRAFVAMQYFGYLHRDPDAAGYDDWVDVLTNGRASAGIAPGDYRHLIFGFIYSVEYRERFGKQ